MKKLILLIITLTALISSCWASFPFYIGISSDTLQIEEIKKYHSSLIKMGIDLKDCRCESCRKSNNLLAKNTTPSNATALALYFLSGLILLGVIIWLLIGLTSAYNCLNNSSDCPQSSGERPNRGSPAGLGWMSLLILISIGVAIRASLIQLRNKKKLQR